MGERRKTRLWAGGGNDSCLKASIIQLVVPAMTGKKKTGVENIDKARR